MTNNPGTPVAVVLQMAAEVSHDARVPTPSDFQCWAGEALVSDDCIGRPSEICVRVVGNDESAELNQRYRGRCGPTNVLSFACDAVSLPDDGSEPCPLGDIVIAAPLVVAEACRQGKEVTAHWAHLFIHGMLHLQGYDHEEASSARCMEALEADILIRLGFPTPCQQSSHLPDE